MTNITTLLFDLDGTVVDTNELIIATYLHVLEKNYPGRFQREDVYPFMGPTLEEAFTTVDPDPENVKKLMQEYRKFNLAKHDELVREFDGVYGTLRALHENGYKLGIVTTKRYETALMGLRATKLDPFFETVIALEQVTKVKPDPEPIFKALAELNSSPEEAIMVGDNHTDIFAGKNAGTKTAGVAWSIKGRDYMAEGNPDYILEHIADLFSILEE